MTDMNSIVPQNNGGSIVVDVGGTNLRVAYFDGQQLSRISRSPIISFRTHPELPPSQLVSAFYEQLELALEPLLTEFPDSPLGIAFPGPIDQQGRVAQAPTLWGTELRDLPILEVLQARLGRPVVIQNDITAAAWRYAASIDEDFCVITVSSGIGNKVFRQGEVLLSPHGFGGEMGHCQVADGDYDLACDCGGSGHLGALASGRGTLQLSYRYAQLYPEKIAQSILLAADDSTVRLHDVNPHWTTQDLVAGIHQQDAFCQEVLDLSQGFLIRAMSHLYHAIGVHRFVFIGGFAVAIGEAYVANLNRLLSQQSWFGLSEDAMTHLCCLGAADDDHSLIGLGYYLQQTQE